MSPTAIPGFLGYAKRWNLETNPDLFVLGVPHFINVGAGFQQVAVGGTGGIDSALHITERRCNDPYVQSGPSVLASSSRAWCGGTN